MDLIKDKFEKKNMGGGMLPTPDDEQDFLLGAIGIKPELPKEPFIVSSPLEIKDQQRTDFCTAYASCAMSEAQEGIKLNPGYTFAKTKQIMGSWKNWGADLRSACKSATEHGFLNNDDFSSIWGDSEKPIINENKWRDFVANWENWPAMADTFSKKHKKQAYFLVDGFEKDIFDSIRAVLWTFRDEKRLVLTGAMWRDQWTYAYKGILANENRGFNFGHSYCYIGQTFKNNEPYLIAQLSNGTSIGDGGLFYFPRSVVNKENVYKNFMFLDLPQELTEEYKTEISEKSMLLQKGVAGRVFYFFENYLSEIMK